jgi:adenylate cyclase
MTAVSPETLRFADFVLDLARCSLRRGADDVQLRPKAFDMLCYMARHPGRLIPKDELVAATWPGLFVTDDSLVQCIKDIRDALNDGEHRIIQTVPRRGYLFAAEVHAAAPPAQSIVAIEPRMPRELGQRAWVLPPARMAIVLTAALVLLAALGSWLLIDSGRWLPGSGSTHAERKSIAVLPLASVSNPSTDDYFAEGLTEDIISALGRFQEISVRSRGAVASYKGRTPRPQDVGRDLGVRYVIEGSVRRTDEHVRISIQLSDAERGTVLWAHQYESALKDIFAVQDDITRRIAGSLVVRLNALELARVATKPPERLEAYDLVLRGRDLLARVTRSANAQARSMFEKAIAIDPTYVPALVGLGNVDLNAVRYGWTVDPAEALRRAEQLGHKAITADASNPGAHALLGRVYIRRGDLERALDAMNRAIALNPSDPDSHAGLGNALLLLGDIDNAIKAIETAIQLHPAISVTNYFRLGMAYIIAGRPNDAIRTLERAVVRGEQNVYLHGMLAGAYAESGRKDAARRQAEKVRQLSAVFEGGELGSLFRNPDQREKLLGALRKAGL